MPATTPEYRVDPTDGGPARVVGAWAKDKQFYLSRYTTIFANAMRRKWDRLCYLDLFSGPGTCVIEGTNDFYEGSALSAIARPFTDFIFVDKDPSALSALRARTVPLAAGRQVTFIGRDCNEAIDEIIAAIPQRALALAFIDPTNWQIQFETVRKLVDERPMDVILTFQGGMLKRVSHLDQPRVDAFFGADTWKPAKGEAPHLYDLCELYRRQMAKLGYADHAPALDPKMRTLTNTPLYHLLFFSRNEKGHDFWDEVVAVSPTGQLNLFSAPDKSAKKKR
jgi:three-Cys-motif partner protein